MHSRRMTESVVIAMFILCAWFFIDAHFNNDLEESVGFIPVERPWLDEAAEAEEGSKTPEQEITHSIMREGANPTSTAQQHTTMLTQVTAAATPSPSLPDRIVVMAKLPTDDTEWVHTDLADWQSAIYEIDTDTPYKESTLDPLTNSTLRTLRNKGREANAYLAYIVQNYNNLPSTIAFIHPHKDGYPTAWHTDNNAHSNPLSLQILNVEFVQRNGYANLRCIHIPGCPDEVMPFRDPPDDDRKYEAAMPRAWLDLFNSTDVPHVLATPCCAQFAVSSAQVRKRPLDAYRQYYTWLMETPLEDGVSGRVLEYLWHVLFGQEPV